MERRKYFPVRITKILLPLAGASKEEMEEWSDIPHSQLTFWRISLLTSKCQPSNESEEISVLKGVIEKQQELIEKLQKGVTILLNEKDSKRLARPNQAFYKE